MQEEWREVFHGYYEVSNLGRVRRNRKERGTKVGAILSPASHPRGPGKIYKRIALWRYGKKTDCYVHRLVAEAFIGPCPPKHEVNHIDGDPSNNVVTNLEYVTSSQNKQHFWLVNRHLIQGSNNWAAKLTEADVAAIRALIEKGFTQKYIARVYNVAQSTIEKIHLGQRWKHLEVSK